MNPMKIFKEFFRVQLPSKPQTVKPGIYHFRSEAGGNVTRFHLRVEEDGSGILLANASVAARLSPTGVLIAKARLEGAPNPEISNAIKDVFYGATKQQIESDVRTISELIGELANPEDNYPIFNLDDPAIEQPRSLLAPFHAQMRMADPELTLSLLDKLWNNGIMHVTFSVLATDSDESVTRNVQRAEDLGMICGIRCTASWFANSERFQKFALAGVDYIIAPVLSTIPEKQNKMLGQDNYTHLNETIQLCKQWEVTPVLEIPIFRDNAEELESLVNEFQAKGVSNVLFYAISNEHQPQGLSAIEMIRAAANVIEITRRSRVRYVWLPAVSITGTLPTILENGPRTAGDESIHVEPDGSVYPPRGPFIAAGNLKSESWNEIWNREVFRRYRERIESPTHCDICPELEVCGPDCPGDPAGWVRQESKGR